MLRDSFKFLRGFPKIEQSPRVQEFFSSQKLADQKKRYEESDVESDNLSQVELKYDLVDEFKENAKEIDQHSLKSDEEELSSI